MADLAKSMADSAMVEYMNPMYNTITTITTTKTKEVNHERNTANECTVLCIQGSKRKHGDTA